MSFDARLKVLREERGLKQRELASIMGVWISRIGMFETGNAHPTIVEIKSLCRYFKVRPAWLAWGEGAMNDEAMNDGVNDG